MPWARRKPGNFWFSRVALTLVTFFQVFSYTMDKEIRIDDLCLDVAKSGAAVQMVKCHHMKGNQLWEFNEKVKN